MFLLRQIKNAFDWYQQYFLMHRDFLVLHFPQFSGNIYNKIKPNIQT